MKKVMQNKSLLHRLIALTMAVVMTLTLVAIDSHFHLFAEDGRYTDHRCNGHCKGR